MGTHEIRLVLNWSLLKLNNRYIMIRFYHYTFVHVKYSYNKYKISRDYFQSYLWDKASFLFLLRFIYLFWKRESRAHMHGAWEPGKEQRERERASEADSPLSAEPNMGLSRMILRSRLEPKPRVRCSTNLATQVPWKHLFIYFISHLYLFQSQWSLSTSRSPQ